MSTTNDPTTGKQQPAEAEAVNAAQRSADQVAHDQAQHASAHGTNATATETTEQTARENALQNAPQGPAHDDNDEKTDGSDHEKYTAGYDAQGNPTKSKPLHTEAGMATHVVEGTKEESQANKTVMRDPAIDSPALYAQTLAHAEQLHADKLRAQTPMAQKPSDPPADPATAKTPFGEKWNPNDPLPDKDDKDDDDKDDDEDAETGKKRGARDTSTTLNTGDEPEPF